MYRATRATCFHLSTHMRAITTALSFVWGLLLLPLWSRCFPVRGVAKWRKPGEYASYLRFNCSRAVIAGAPGVRRNLPSRCNNWIIV